MLNTRKYIAFLAFLGHLACSSSAGQDREIEAPLAGSSETQREFRQLTERFSKLPGKHPSSLARDLGSFVSRHPNDRTSTLAWLYLAWLRLETGDTKGAHVALTRSRVKPGTTRDYGEILTAGIEMREGGLQRATRRLAELRGKLVDDYWRYLHGQLSIRAALQSGDTQAAIDAILAALADAAPGHRHWVRTAALERIAGLKTQELELSFERLKSQDPKVFDGHPERVEALNWLLAELQERLQADALKAQDARLAERLLRRDPNLARGDNAALVELASESARPSRIFGKTVGFLLNTASIQSRTRSAASLRGLSRELGATQSAGVRLSTRQYDGSAEALAIALGHLAADGAGIVVGGIHAEDAARLRSKAFKHGLAILLLASPAVSEKQSPSRLPNVFVLGETAARERAVLEQGLKAVTNGAHATLDPTAPYCNPTHAVVGQERFPISDWQAAHIETLFLLGDEHCASQLGEALSRTRYRPRLALGLEVAHRFIELAPKFDILYLRADTFPQAANPSRSWFEALGYDAALLARHALADFPPGVVTDPTRIGALRGQAVTALAQAQLASLSTSQSGSFDAGGQLQRALKADFQ